jgi:hypothetical protein
MNSHPECAVPGGMGHDLEVDLLTASPSCLPDCIEHLKLKARRKYTTYRP